MRTVLLWTCVCLTLTLGQSLTSDLIASAETKFSQTLYGKIGANQSQTVYSPYSIHSVLSMTSLGARGRTVAEMLLALGLDGIQGGPHDGYHSLISQLNSAGNVSMNTANGVFLNPRFRIESSFVQQCRDKYFAEAGELEMMAAQGPELKVNQFVENRTQGMVKDLLPKYSLTADTAMVLINTVVFNGSWAKTFSKHATRSQTFNQLENSTSQVDMMRDTRSVNVKTASTLNADIAQLPFKGDRFSLYIVLPHENNGITDLESALSGVGADLFEGFKKVHTHLEIPKFKIEASFELKETLKDMGMLAAFDAGLADFSGLTAEPNAYISSVKHKAVFDLQEYGVAASAATSVTIAIKNMVIGGAKPRDFIADHPFVFYLRDDLTKMVLFQGKFSG